MTTIKDFEVIYVPNKKTMPKVGEEVFYKVDIALKPELTSVVQIMTTFTTPFVMVTGVGGDYPCTTWVGSIIGSLIRVHARTESPEQLTGSLFIRVTDAALAVNLPKK